MEFIVLSFLLHMLIQFWLTLRNGWIQIGNWISLNQTKHSEKSEWNSNTLSLRHIIKISWRPPCNEWTYEYDWRFFFFIFCSGDKQRVWNDHFIRHAFDTMMTHTKFLFSLIREFIYIFYLYLFGGQTSCWETITKYTRLCVSGAVCFNLLFLFFFLQKTH